MKSPLISGHEYLNTSSAIFDCHILDKLFGFVDNGIPELVFLRIIDQRITILESQRTAMIPSHGRYDIGVNPFLHVRFELVKHLLYDVRCCRKNVKQGTFY